MKKNFLVGAIIFAGYALFALEPASKEINLTENILVSVSKVKDPLSSISVNGQKYVARDNGVIVQFDYLFKSVDRKKSEIPPTGIMELACLNENDEIVYIPMQITDYLDRNRSFSDMFTKEYLDDKGIRKITYYFIRGKKDRPIAITFDRNKILLFKKTNPGIDKLEKDILLKEKIDLLMQLARNSSFEEIGKYLSENNLELSVNDYKGYSLFDYALLFGNNRLLQDIIDNDFSIDKEIYSRSTKETPIDIVLKSDNIEGFRILINNGQSLTEKDYGSKDSPIQKIIRQNKFNFLPVLLEMGADLKNIKLSYGMGGSDDPLTFAKKRNYQEMISFFSDYYKQNNIGIMQ